MPGWDEFYKEYEQPKINNITVGFSGIDPQQRNSGSGTNIDVTEQIANYIKKITIKIDSGNVDPDAVEPEEPYIPLKPSDIPHEELAGLLGGDGTGHYHLTKKKLENLEKLIEVLVPEGEEVELPEVIRSHEELGSLLGGKNGEHYHFTGDEWTKIKKVLALLYPDGSDEPVIPGGDEPDGPTPGGDDDVDRFGGLPAANPPQWTPTQFPTGYEAFEGVHKMYYGKMHVNSSEAALEGLLVPMKKGTSIYLLRRSLDLNSWEDKTDTMKEYASSGIAQYLYLDTERTSVYRHIVYLMLPSGAVNKIYYARQTKGFDGYISTSNTVVSTAPYVAAAYSSTLEIAIFVSSDGNVARVKKDASLLTTAENRSLVCGMAVNPGCAAWVPTAYHFCVSGPDGTATSADGTSWVKHTSAPHNLKDLTWREDFADGACLFAWREEDRKFYASPDGATWTIAGNLPTTDQINTIAAVDYNPDLQWYCAIGGANRHAYFSKDLKTWRSSNVVTEYATEVNMGSVIWMPSTKKYVLMPTSGTTYYTFSPDDWK